MVFGFAAVLQARAVRHVEAPNARRLLLRLLREPLFLASVALSIAGFCLHLVAVRTIPLYLAQAGIAGSLAVTALLAVVLIHERLTTADWWAVAAITVGLAVLAIASGDIGEGDLPDGFVLGLYVGIVVVLLLGMAVYRSQSPYVASALGVLAGLGFAGSGLAARVLPGLTPAELWDSPATYALPHLRGAGLRALLAGPAPRLGHRGDGPDDRAADRHAGSRRDRLARRPVRDGMAAVAVVGFVLTCAGAVALARFEGGPEGHGGGEAANDLGDDVAVTAARLVFPHQLFREHLDADRRRCSSSSRTTCSSGSTPSTGRSSCCTARACGRSPTSSRRRGSGRRTSRRARTRARTTSSRAVPAPQGHLGVVLRRRRRLARAAGLGDVEGRRCRARADGVAGLLTTRTELRKYFSNRPRRMKHFYEWQRKRLGILVDGDQPVGGKWSLDPESRKKLPEGREGPAHAAARRRPSTPAPRSTGSPAAFPDNPGDAEAFRWPTTRGQAERWLTDFLEQRFELFGLVRGRDGRGRVVPVPLRAVATDQHRPARPTRRRRPSAGVRRGARHPDRRRRGVRPPGDRVARVHARHLPDLRAPDAHAERPGAVAPDPVRRGGTARPGSARSTP